ncbi:NAD-dependent epimerase/dehydratase family protein [Nocardioides bruguierae]|uniref:NAD-dependent epimerase/dehydratase family protein n=1 Tax=Nocardioides bruguierae TaxID=2945102 RepID=A0A9X2D627_9ACTN|nr:NAD-dependent epimerase/dehydratase family protein [Nocardioides bruguierae]MCM0620082.1 NAD-dependent epimerase/dehydratase family protein [Nocardioides bruguierae]
MTQKVVVAGATGFIGGHVAETLVRAGLDAFAVGRTTNVSVGRFDRGSACAVIDCAGLDPDRVKALKTAFPDSRYVLVSSAAVYRALEEPSALVDERCEVAPLGTRTDYVDKKLRCEELIIEQDAVVVRPVDVVGPRDPHDRIQYWAALGREDSNGVAFCEPTRRIEFVDVRDLATLLLFCATNTDRPTPVVNARVPA